MPMTFSEALRYGRKGELLIGFALRERGWFTEDLAAIKGQPGIGPRMYGPYNTGIVLPDLRVSGKGKTFPFECKAKRQANWTKALGQFEHGIGQRSYLQYQAYEQQTGLNLILGFFEEKTGELLVRSLKNLGDGRPCLTCPHEKTDGHCPVCPMDRGGMLFWPRDQFRVFGQIAPPKDMPLFHDVILPPTLPLVDDLGNA